MAAQQMKNVCTVFAVARINTRSGSNRVLHQQFTVLGDRFRNVEVSRDQVQCDLCMKRRGFYAANAGAAAKEFLVLIEKPQFELGAGLANIQLITPNRDGETTHAEIENLVGDAADFDFRRKLPIKRACLKTLRSVPDTGPLRAREVPVMNRE